MQSKKTIIILLNIAYISKYNFNLILLKQLYKSKILYYNYFNSIIVKKKKFP